MSLIVDNYMSGKFKQKLIFILGLLFMGYQLYTGYFLPLPGLMHRAIHIGFGVTMIYLCYPSSKKNRSAWLYLDAFLAMIMVAITVYVIIIAEHAELRAGIQPRPYEYVLGLLLFITIVEAARRTTGLAFPVVVITFMLYAWFGPWLPEPFTHAGVSFGQMVARFFLNTQGVYGTITGVSANYIALFILLAAFIREFGAGEFFKDFAISILGTVRGGPAKLSIIASSLMGMITGSSIANICSVGSFTIPLMKSSGYRAEMAGGIEAVAGMGAQIMPPVMGGTVFIIMEVLGISYWTIAAAAFPIALLMYFGLFLAVDYEAIRLGIGGLSRSEIPKTSSVLKAGWFHVIPIIILVFELAIMKVSPTRASFLAVVSVPIVQFLFNRKNLSFKRLMSTLEMGAHDTLTVVGIVGAAGLVSGVVGASGLGVMLSSILVTLAGNNVFLLLVFAAITCIILGMGLPVMVSYIIVSVLVAPALIDLGVLPLAAHLFVFYYAIISVITPPVAPDAFVAGGIAKANPVKVGIESCKLGMVIYLLPFAMIYNPALIGQGGLSEVIATIFFTALGTYALASGIQGRLLPGRRLNVLERGIFLVSAVLLITPNNMLKIVGLIIVLVIQVLTLLAKSWSRGKHPEGLQK